MPVSQENEAVLKGKVAPKKKPDFDNDIEEEKDDPLLSEPEEELLELEP